jgi:hypothetical protein
LRLGGRERQNGEPSGERGRNCNSADIHRGSPELNRPITIAGDKTNANHIADFGDHMLGANAIVGIGFDAAPARAWIRRPRKLKLYHPRTN